MLSWFTSKSVQRTKQSLQNPYAVYDLTLLEWEQRQVLLQQQKVYICSEKMKKNMKNKKYELIFKKERFSIFSIYRDIDRERVEQAFNSVKSILNLLSDGITSKKPRVIALILKDIVNSVIDHPNWTSAHISAKVGLDNLFATKASHIMTNLNARSAPDLSTPLHLAIESGRVNTTKEVLAFKPKIDLKDWNGNTAVHLAAMANKDILNLILKEQNVFEIIKETNNKGCTPLHLSCYGEKYDNVIQFLEFGLTVQMLTISLPRKRAKRGSKKVRTDKNNNKIIQFNREDIEDLDTESMQFGGTPLHWVKHRRALEKLIGFGFDLNVPNAKGETALYTMVKKMRLKCMIGLLCFGANVKKADKLGDTPLHCAIKAADVTSSQALIVFDSDINARNKKNESPRHIAAQIEQADHHMVLYLLSAIGAKRCGPHMKDCKSGCAHNDHYEGKPYYRWPDFKNEKFYKPILLEPIIKEAINRKKNNPLPETQGVRMLCLDGGGIRGLITIQILIELERRLNISISSCFEWIAGTSTGSILALLIASGRQLPEMRGIYFRFKDKIMVGSRPYSSKNFETLLEEEIGPKYRMCDVKDMFNKYLIINATLIDRNPAKLHVFRSFESSEEVLGLPDVLQGFKVYPNYKEQIVWKACRASGAAPTYFRASGPFLDGGLIANNPTLDALTEFKLYNNSLKAVGRADESRELNLVLSLGTGKFPITPIEPIDVVRMWSFNPREIHKNTLYVKQMGNLLINQVCATEGHVIDRAQAWCSGIKTPYFRINPVLSEVIALDETRDIEICNSLWETKAFMYAMKAEVENIVQLILKSNQSQSNALQVPHEENMSTGPTTGYAINLSSTDVQINTET